MKSTTTNTMNQTDINLNHNYAHTMVADTDAHQQLQTQTTHDIADTLTGTQTYYRSRIFTPFGGDNPLVASAAVLLSLLNRLRTYHYFSDAFSLQNQLLNEIHVFETLAQHKKCNAENIRIARYVLCATFDEILLTAVWDEQNIWEQKRLSSRFEEDTDGLDGSERFFLILERLMENPQRHLHLLELMYICLSLGFEGKYHGMSDGKTQLDNIIDKLFHCITQIRGEQPALLTPATHATPMHAIPTHVAALVLALSSAILSSAYFLFNYMLSIRAAPLTQTLETILQNIQPFTL